MVTPKESPTEERVKRAARIPKAKSQHVLVFTGGKKPLSSSAPEKTVGCTCGECCDFLSTSTLISQEDLEQALWRARELSCVETRIAVALSKGAKIDRGVHTAELVPTRGKDGHVHLKVVIR